MNDEIEKVKNELYFAGSFNTNNDAAENLNGKEIGSFLIGYNEIMKAFFIIYKNEKGKLIDYTIPKDINSYYVVVGRPYNSISEVAAYLISERRFKPYKSEQSNTIQSNQDPVLLLIFDFDQTLVAGHTRGNPIQNNFEIDNANLVAINKYFKLFQERNCKIIILSRAIDTKLKMFFQNMYTQGKFTFQPVDIIAPDETTYSKKYPKDKRKEETLFWANWKAEEGKKLIAKYPGIPALFLDDTLENVIAMTNEVPKIMSQNIPTIIVPVGNYMKTLETATEFLNSHSNAGGSAKYRHRTTRKKTKPQRTRKLRRGARKKTKVHRR